jgi:hypothetical protein
MIELESIVGSEYLVINPDTIYEIDCRHNIEGFDCVGCLAEKNRDAHNPNSRFFPTSQGFGVTHDNAMPKEFGVIHDTFKLDRYDNLYDSHTTYQKGSNSKRIGELDDYQKSLIDLFIR